MCLNGYSYVLNGLLITTQWWTIFTLMIFMNLLDALSSNYIKKKKEIEKKVRGPTRKKVMQNKFVMLKVVVNCTLGCLYDGSRGPTLKIFKLRLWSLWICLPISAKIAQLLNNSWDKWLETRLFCKSNFTVLFIYDFMDRMIGMFWLNLGHLIYICFFRSLTIVHINKL